MTHSVSALQDLPLARDPGRGLAPDRASPNVTPDHGSATRRA
jgi:hypothetical protein